MQAYRTPPSHGAVVHVSEVCYPAVALAVHLVAHSPVLGDGLDVGAVVLLLGEPEAPHERGLVAAGRVGAGHGSGPDVGDGRGGLGLPSPGHLYVGVVLPDPLLGHLAHLVGIVLYISGKSDGAGIGAGKPLFARLGIYGVVVAEPGGDVDHGAVERHGDGG